MSLLSNSLSNFQITHKNVQTMRANIQRCCTVQNRIFLTGFGRLWQPHDMTKNMNK